MSKSYSNILSAIVITNCNAFTPLSNSIFNELPQHISEYVDTAVRHVMMRQGILGVKVSIMLPHDPKGIIGPKSLLSDVITILEPKESN